MSSVSPEVLERAKKIMAEGNGHIAIQLEQPTEKTPTIENIDFVPLEPVIDHTKPPPFKLPDTSMQYEASKDLSAPKNATKVETDIGQSEDVNQIKIWQDKPTGKCAIAIGTQLYEIPVPIFELFTRMVANIRTLGSDLETERFNNKKLKQSMVQ